MTIWQHLQQAIAAHTGQLFELLQQTPVSGGDVNQAFKLSGSLAGVAQCYFVKLNQAGFEEMFAQEELGLAALAQTRAIRVPEAVIWGEYGAHSYLVMEYIDMGLRGDVAEFAKALAKLHSEPQQGFGFEHDNYIGRTPQPNKQDSDWGRFFCEQRLGFQLDLLERQNASPRLINKGRKLLPQLAEYLNQHNPQPALVHGDLWQGNWSFASDGTPLIYDPAVYWADHEVDLAMLELFGNPGKTFFQAYRQVHPIKAGYEQRKTAYNLYHILNHANAFGSSYADQASWMMDELRGCSG